METLILPAVITGVLAILSPFITALFTKSSMKSETKGLVGIAVSIVVAVVWVLLTGGFAVVAGPEDLAIPIGVIFGIQQAVYNQFFKDLAKDVEANVGFGAHEETDAHLEPVEVSDDAQYEVEPTKGE